MNNLFNGLQIVGGETKIVSISETASVEVSGKFSMERGNFKQEFSYWARTYEKYNFSYYEIGNFAKVDDFDTENHKCTLGELTIDSLGALKTTLTNSGLITLSNSLGFSNEEISNAMHQHIQEHKIFKAVYGKKCRLWDLLLSDEKELINLKFVVANYDKCSDYQKRECGVNVYDEEGKVIPNGVPTKEVLEFVLGGIAN